MYFCRRQKIQWSCLKHWAFFFTSDTEIIFPPVLGSSGHFYKTLGVSSSNLFRHCMSLRFTSRISSVCNIFLSPPVLYVSCTLKSTGTPHMWKCEHQLSHLSTSGLFLLWSRLLKMQHNPLLKSRKTPDNFQKIIKCQHERGVTSFLAFLKVSSQFSPSIEKGRIIIGLALVV